MKLFHPCDSAVEGEVSASLTDVKAETWRFCGLLKGTVIAM